MSKVTFCPFCGSSDIKVVKDMTRCRYCRTVFIVSYSRQLRKAPKKQDKRVSKEDS